MDIENIIQTIITIPRAFKTANKSTVALLMESGYYEEFDKVNECNIADALKKNLSVVEDWFIWSKDKRSSPGWYFYKESDNDFVVGFHQQGIEGDHLHFADKITACAVFIKREMESVRL